MSDFDKAFDVALTSFLKRINVPELIPHLLDTDDNAGQYFREDIKAAVDIHIIGEDKCTCGCDFGDGCLCLSDGKLRAEQRKRNQ